MIRKALFLILFIQILLLLNYSCSHDIYNQKMKKSKEVIIFPSPPDTTRIQFLTSITYSTDVTGSRSGFMNLILGEPDSKRQINKPYGINIHKGKIYVCDAGINGLDIIDLEKRTFVQFSPKGKGVLKIPLNCYVDENNQIYVADGERKQIVIFDENLNYLNSFGMPGAFKPTDVFIYDDKIWVPDCNGNKVDVFDRKTLTLSYDLPKIDKGKDGFLYSPTNVFVNSDKLYVTDMGDYRVKMYTHDGKYLSSIGSYGTAPSQFTRPKGIAVDKESNFYVVDAGFENIQIFNNEGNLLMFFGGPYTGPGYMWLPAKVIIDYDNLEYFRKYLDPSFEMKYLIFVTNQYGPDKISIYAAVTPRKK